MNSREGSGRCDSFPGTWQDALEAKPDSSRGCGEELQVQPEPPPGAAPDSHPEPVPGNPSACQCHMTLPRKMDVIWPTAGDQRHMASPLSIDVTWPASCDPCQTSLLLMNITSDSPDLERDLPPVVQVVLVLKCPQGRGLTWDERIPQQEGEPLPLWWAGLFLMWAAQGGPPAWPSVCAPRRPWVPTGRLLCRVGPDSHIPLCDSAPLSSSLDIWVKCTSTSRHVTCPGDPTASHRSCARSGPGLAGARSPHQNDTARGPGRCCVPGAQ